LAKLVAEVGEKHPNAFALELVCNGARDKSG